MCESFSYAVTSKSAGIRRPIGPLTPWRYTAPRPSPATRSMSSTPGRHALSFSCSATNANTSGRVLLMTMLFSAEGILLASLTRDERPREVVRIERPEVLELLPHADQLDGEPELVRDRDRDPALCAAVQLRQRDAGDADRVAEEPGLLQAVLPRRRVDDQERLVRRAGQPAFDDPSHLRQLLHQVRLRVQAAGRVDDDDVPLVLPRALDRVERNGGGIRPALGADELRARAVSPDLQLFLRRRTERVCRPEHHGVPVLAKTFRQLADRGRLARAVDPDDEQHARICMDGERGGLAEEDRDLVRERGRELGEGLARLEALNELGGRGRADVGAGQRVPEPVPLRGGA